ncbi:Nuclear receptor corepressor 2,Nuclear receptor corepressor 1 [Lepeophtheirus salmonis]|uniref:Nuclear receptor corepressor 2,Nuclear receptor corepressor 1 n=1 Tax=Lepeophtheirus salmonis TaxID=72036 RepID=A0A7R8CHG5_LEPSM|nr:Nuclear receptor corepressor 2,Nuclear receptor corepressor 1 [Lepeophtheirus salmonis]CAF2824242.1 Nuclear receptor corepressor 2,Nuclear receptor corepressor 1 [Lepeophtheirus salmonis]
MSTVRSMDIRGGGGGSGSGGGGSPSLGPPNSAGPNSAVATGSGGPSPHPSLYGRLSHPRQPLGAPYLPSSSSSSGPGNDHLKGRSSSNNNNNINVSSNPGGGGSNNYCRSSNSPSVVSSRNSSSAVNSPYPPQLVSGFPGSSRPPPSGGGVPDHPASMRYVQYSPSPAGPSSSTRHPPPHSVGVRGQAHSDSRHSNHPAPRMTLRPTYPNSQASSLYHNDNYMRDVQAVAVAAASAHRSQPAPPSSLPAGIHLSSIHSQSPSSLSASHGMEIPPKRPRMDLGHPNQISSSPAPSLSTPLRIDTREPNKDSGYHPQVEAISPTGPEASAERDELRSTKDDLLQKITKVDREIAKAESQIAKLKKKQQELEDAANRPSTDAVEEDEKPKNQSIAQIIYAENRKKARDAHAMLDKLAPHNELPLYNQPSDTVSYHENKRNHAHFKKQLVEYFKKRNEERESRERHMTETYSKLTTQWLKKVEKLENSKKRREKEQRARDLYEKIFPELRKQREDKERDHRLGTRGAVRSEADIENVIERLQEQELENKKMHSYAVIPPLLLPQEERRRKFINNNGLILDPLKEYEDRKYLNIWTEEEKQTFKERFLQHPKNFGVIAQSLERKKTSPMQFNIITFLKRQSLINRLFERIETGSRRRKVQPTAPEVIGPNAHGVVTRHRNREQEKLEPNENNDISNRSTPVLKSENNMKSEDYNEEEGDKKFKKEAIDTSDDEESNQIKSGPPHPCAVCKVTVEASRPVHSKSYAIQLGLREEDVGSDSRVCNKCHCIALRKRHGHCPVPTCTSTKGRGLKVKNRFRHLPSKWAELPDEIKGPIIAEMQLPEGIKKCCSGCVTRLTRKISQASSGISNQSNTDINVKNEEDAKWSDEDVELMKNCLVEFGRNWTHISKGLIKVAIKPPVLSTDEESGSSTSSCDEETTYNNVNTTASTSASTVVMHVSSASTSTLIPTTTTTPSGASTETSSRPTENDIQVVKSEVKSIENHIKSESGETAPTLPPPPPVVPAKTLIKEEDNDSSTTMSADEVEINPPRSIYSGQQQPYLLSGQGGVPPNVPGSRDMARSYSCRQFQPPPPPSHHHHHHRSLPPPPQPTLNDNSLQNGPVREVMTVRDLMRGSIANPTIHTILENSGPAPHKTNYIRDRIGLNPLQKKLYAYRKFHGSSSSSTTATYHE